MAGMFNYFTDKASSMGSMLPLTEEERRRRALLEGGRIPVSPTVLGGGQLQAPPQVVQPAPQPGITNVDLDTYRPQLAPPVRATPQASPVVGVEQRLQAQRQKTDGYRDVTGPAVYDEQGRQLSGKPVNNDHGVLGRVGDVLRQAVISAGEAYGNSSGDPGQRLMSAIGGGIAGGVGGGFRPTMDEERQRLRNIGMSEAEEQRIMANREADVGYSGRQATVDYTQARPVLEQNKIDADRLGTQVDALKSAQQNIYNRWKELPTFDPADPNNAGLMVEAQQAGISLPKKAAGEEYYATWSPDGQLAIVNTKTGEERRGFNGEKFSKPTTVTQSDFPDTSFPFLRSENDIKLQAQSEVAPELDNIVINPQTESDLVNYSNMDGEFPYRNQDGTFNKNKFLQDVAVDGLAPVQYSNLYRSQARSIQNKIAKRELALRDAQRGTRAEVDRFTLSLKGKPAPVADEALGLFNQIMQMPKGAKRDRALKELRKQLG